MKFALAPVFKSQGFPVAFSLEEAWQALDTGGDTATPQGPVAFSGTVVLAGDVFVLKGRARMAYRTVCGRCGEDVDAEICVDIDEQYARAEDERHPDRYIFQGDTVDFTPMLQEQMVLNIPQKHLCREDCRGICPVCATNLNLAQCACAVGGAEE